MLNKILFCLMISCGLYGAQKPSSRCIPCLTFTNEAALFSRGHVDKHCIVSLTGATNVDLDCQLTAQDLSQRFDTGWRSNLMIQTQGCGSLEFQFTGFLHWEKSTSITGDGDLEVLFMDNHIDQFLIADEIFAKARTWLTMYELLYWRNVCPRRCDYFSVGWQIGPSFFIFKDKLDLRGVIESSEDDFATLDLEYNNKLMGAQLGFTFESTPCYRINWGIKSLGGLYANSVDAVMQGSSTFAGSTSSFIDQNVDKTCLSYSLQVNPYVDFYLCPCLFLKIAYEGLWLGSIAIAAEQIDPNLDLEKIHCNANAIFHGALIGLALEF